MTSRKLLDLFQLSELVFKPNIQKHRLLEYVITTFYKLSKLTFYFIS